MCENEKDYTFSNFLLALGLCPVLFIVALFSIVFFSIDKVYAAEMQLPLPTRMCVDGKLLNSTGGLYDGTRCGNGNLVSWWDEPFYSGPTNGFQIGGYSGGEIYFSNNIQYDILDYCKGENIILIGEIGGLFDFFKNQLVEFKFIMNNTPLSCNIEMINSSRIKYTCTGVGGGNFIASVSTPSYSSNVTYEVGFSKKIGVTCDSTNGDIIINDKNNTQQIINNQNQNKEEIIGAINGNGLNNNKPTDNTDFENYENAESGLMNEENLNAINDIDISIDSNSSDFIWTLVTRILNTHALVFGAVITCLSLGVIKLILNR